MLAGPCIRATIIGMVTKGPMPTISIMLIAVAWDKDKPLSNFVVLAACNRMNYLTKYKMRLSIHTCAHGFIISANCGRYFINLLR